MRSLALIIHINLNTICYTYVEDSSTKTIYIKYYKKKKSIPSARLEDQTQPLFILEDLP